MLEKRRADVEKDPYSAKSWGRLGIAFDIHGLYAEAIECYTRAQELDSKDYRWSYFMGLCHRIGDDRAALDHFLRARSLNDEYAPIQVHTGNGLLKVERHDEAKAAFERAIQLAPTLIPAHLGLARIDLARNQPEEALRRLLSVLEMKPTSGEIFWLLAETYRRLA